MTTPPPSAVPPVSSGWNSIADLVLPAFVCTGLAWLGFRTGPLLTFDGYYYVEFAKRFASEWPDRFGRHWPFGWPLAGGLLGRIGVPAYPALLFLSLLAVLVLLAATAVALRQHPLRRLLLVALAAAPIVPLMLGSVLSELPFAAVWMVLGLSLARWPERRAIWLAAACAVLALALRYAGLIALGAIAIWLVTRWRELAAAGRLRTAIGATMAASLLCALLLGWNIVVSGHASGAERGVTAGLGALPREFASFGWSAPSALLAGGLRDRIGPESIAGWLIGAACFAVITALCVRAWFRPRSAFSRPGALLALGYAAGMCVLHCLGEFDPLYSARTFLPALAPLLVLAAEQLAEHRRSLILAASVLLVSGALAGFRGVSREIGGDVRPALAPLRARLAPDDRIAINDHAFAITAYLPQQTLRVGPAQLLSDVSAPFVVVAGKPRNRAGDGAQVPADWRAALAASVARRAHRYLLDSPSLIVVEKNTPSTQPDSLPPPAAPR